jgi:hypothetical protein
MRDLYLHTASPWSPKLWLPTPGCCPRREKPRCRRLACGNGGQYQPWVASPMPLCGREHVTSLVHNHPAGSYASLPRHMGALLNPHTKPKTRRHRQRLRVASFGQNVGGGRGIVRAHHEGHELLLETLACVAIVRRARYCCRCHCDFAGRRFGFHVFFNEAWSTELFSPSTHAIEGL